MKNILFVKSLILVLFLTGSLAAQDNTFAVTEGENQIILDFNLPYYTISKTDIEAQTFSLIEMKGGAYTDKAGKPRLPFLAASLNIPDGAKDIIVNYSNLQTETIPMGAKVYPAQEESYIGESPKAFVMDEVYYESEGNREIVNMSDVYSFIGKKGVNVYVYPFQYNPVKDELRVVVGGTFTVEYTLAKTTKVQPQTLSFNSTSDFFLNTKKTTNIVSKSATVNNAKSAISIERSTGYNPPQGNSGARVLVITDPVFENHLDDFINHKARIGYEVNVVSTNITGTTSAQIDNYIDLQYADPDTYPLFVILIGDAEDIPPAETGSVNQGGTNTELNSDRKYADTAGDPWYSDIFIGRIPISSSDANAITQLNNYIDKVIYMDNNIHKFNKRAALLRGVVDDDQINSNCEAKAFSSTKYMDETHSDVMDILDYYDPNWVFVNYRNNSEYSTGSCYLSHTLPINELNNNPIHYIYSGHGEYSRLAWLTEAGSSHIDENDFNSATNTVYPIVSAFACKSGNIQKSSSYNYDCIGEEILTENSSGAIAYYGSSLLAQARCAADLERYTFEYANQETLGQMITNGRANFWIWSNANGVDDREDTYRSFMLLGDPTLQLNKYPHSIFECYADFTFEANTIMGIWAQDYMKLPYENVNLGFNSGSHIAFIANNKIEVLGNMQIKSGSKVYMTSGEIIISGSFEVEAGAVFETTSQDDFL